MNGKIWQTLTTDPYDRNVISIRMSTTYGTYPLNANINLKFMKRLSLCRAVNTPLLGCKNQTINAVQRNNACWILWTT